MVLSKKRARHVIEEIIALFPDAKPSLDFRNHFELLVAVMLSAQTTDAAVNKATPALFEAYPTPQDMAVAGEADIAKYISRLGLYRNKALAEAAGNLNAVAGGNAETFKSVGMVLTQTAGQGKLTTENWNQLRMPSGVSTTAFTGMTSGVPSSAVSAISFQSSPA